MSLANDRYQVLKAECLKQDADEIAAAEKEGIDLAKYVVVPRMECADGFNMSVQAGYGKYSSPREKSSVYFSFEIGYPSAREELLMDYVEDSEHPTDTVYGYVPDDVIDAVIEKHGGLLPMVAA